MPTLPLNCIRIVLCLGLLAALPVSAQTNDEIRGGWIADRDGIRHVYIFVVRDSGITGTYCTDCYNPETLAFIDDGVLDASGLHFSLYHDRGNETVSVRKVEGRLADEKLNLTFDNGETLALVRSPQDTRAAAPSGGFAPPRPYTPPGDPLVLTRENVTGLWLAGTGPGKQYFIFRKHRDGLRGMACGPCIDASGMAPLENIRLEGSNLHFDIMHENSGPGILEYGPHRNITVATISLNEFHLVTRPSFADEDYALIHMTLLGPVRFMP